MTRRALPVLIAITLVAVATVGAGDPPTEHYIHIPIGDRAEISTLTEVVSIDGFVSPLVLKAYATDAQLTELAKLGYEWTEQLHPGRRLSRAAELRADRDCITGFDCYPTYTEYVQRMQQYVADYPDLCRLYDIGDTQEGLDLLVVKISDNPDDEEDEPEVFYTSTMHGDETTGFVLMLRLIDWLLANYGSDPTATEMVDEMEIWINPVANPDGTYRCGSTVCDAITSPVRSYMNGQDPNRSFPDPGDPNYNYPWEIETQAMIDFAEAHSIVLSANFHGGIEVVNYPWDNIYSGFADQYHVDDVWLEAISRDYADSAQANSPSGYMDGQDNGITNGYDWYATRGSRQDFMTYYHGCRETTIELSNTKFLPTSQLDAHWTYNEEALKNYLLEALEGIRGVVTGPGGVPVDATIEVLGHDTAADRSWVYTDPQVGDYHRMISPGTYDLKFSAWGYEDLYEYNVVVGTGDATRVDVSMAPTSTSVSTTGTISDASARAPVAGATIELVDIDVAPAISDGVGQYTLPAVEPGTYTFRISHPLYETLEEERTVSSGTPVHDFTLTALPQRSVTGTVTSTETSAPIAGATVRLLSTAFGPVSTLGDGSYQIDGVVDATYTFQVEAAGFVTVTEEQVVDAASTVHDFALDPTYTVTGTATDLDSGLPLSGATVTVTSTNLAPVTTAPDGSYSIDNVPSGQQAFQVRASEHTTITEQRLISSSTTVQDFVLGPLPTDLSTDLEPDNGGFTATNSPTTTGWEWGAPSGTSPAAHSGSNVWATVLDDDYANSTDAALDAPELALPDGSVVTLTFWHWYDFESNWDGGNVQVSEDGAPFRVLTPASGYPDDSVSALGGPGFTGTGTSWQQVTIDLTPYAGHNVVLRWQFASDGSQVRRGWYLDDIAVTTEVADFEASPLTATIGQDVQFTDLSTGAPTAWLWEFGDGDTSNDQNPTHAFTTADTYTVTLTATYGAGDATRTRTDYITVTDSCDVTFAGLATAVQPAIDIAAADLSWTAASSTCGGPMTYDVWVSPPGGSVSFANPPTLTGLDTLQHRVLGLTGGVDYELGVRASDGVGTADDNTVTVTVTTASHSSGEVDNTCAGGSASVTVTDLEQIVAVLFGAPECSDPGFALTDVDASGATDAADLARECTYLEQGLY